ncbi:MAG: WYL domain-containing protein [Chloroflexota bacterium]|nr:WYL domain-containing protein [Chloroflexota bacterium]
MSRTARLLELMIRVQTGPRFTARELAEEFGVSRRTMLRDLNALSEMGVPLRASPGPGGGYDLPRGARRLSPALTVDEALGLIVSYEALLRYSASPFRAQHLLAVTKLRAALPPDLVGELDQLRRHVAVLDPARDYEAPLLGELFRAAVAELHLSIVYDSASGISERVIYPYGVFAYMGFWYCSCHDYKRGMALALRADRFRSLAPAAGYERPPRVPIDHFVNPGDIGDGELVNLRASVSERGMKNFELGLLFGRIEADPSGHGAIDVRIPASSIDYYAVRLLSIGPEVIVESPPELVAALRDQAATIAKLYPN